MGFRTILPLADRLADLLLQHGPTLVLTGAGCSTASGIPDYRDRDGEWRHGPPVMFDDFVNNEAARRRYWARSMNGWPRILAARPNAAHHALSRLEDAGFLHTLVTQNVDDLHRRAGSRNLVELHGNLKSVVCLQCGERLDRNDLQQRLLQDNPGFQRDMSATAPDGDAVLAVEDLSRFTVPACRRCGGILKPDVVFFGESIPRTRVQTSLQALALSGCLLVIGTSLMVFSGYRYCREARRRGLPVFAVNLGRTRADGEYRLKIEADCGGILTALSERLCPQPCLTAQCRP
jgi:NAD-dependent SIR2 family protein deacetylase